eukprot:Gb_12329 [translate_table: standard]
MSKGPISKCLSRIMAPTEMMEKEIKVPTAPNNIMITKLRKNCFFFT